MSLCLAGIIDVGFYYLKLTVIRQFQRLAPVSGAEDLSFLFEEEGSEVASDGETLSSIPTLIGLRLDCTLSWVGQTRFAARM